MAEIEALPPEPPRAQDYWAKVAKQLALHKTLHGCGEELLEHSRRFRENFTLREHDDSVE